MRVGALELFRSVSLCFSVSLPLLVSLLVEKQNVFKPDEYCDAQTLLKALNRFSAGGFSLIEVLQKFYPMDFDETRSDSSSIRLLKDHEVWSKTVCRVFRYSATSGPGAPPKINRICPLIRIFKKIPPQMQEVP